MMGNEIKEIKWIESRSSCFSVLDEAESKLLIWDLLADDTQPVLVKKIKKYMIWFRRRLVNKVAKV